MTGVRHSKPVDIVRRPSASCHLIGLLVLLSLVSATGQLAAQEAADPVRIYGEMTESGDYRFYGDNDAIIPMWISVDFTSMTNLQSSAVLPYQQALKPGTEREYLFTLEVENERDRRGYSLKYSFAYGDPSSAEHDNSYVYLFPFGHGRKHRVTQGFSGQFSHFGENKYALDFDLEQGDPIYAARGGLVVEVKEDSNVGGPSMRYAEYGNRIVILHDDGSFGNYVHLMQGGADVEVGGEVAPGQRIGRAGATGLASGPHLHFDVRLPERDGGMRSLPVRFSDHRGEPVTPREGAYYYATHPGEPPFEAVFGDELEPREFLDHTKRVAETNQISLRNEQIDLAFVIYLANGFDEPKNVEVSFRLAGMEAETELPVVKTIPPLTEVFITILNADPEAQRWQYAPVVRFR